jgi:hypothetical protein
MIPIDDTKPEIVEVEGVKYFLLPIVGPNELLYWKVLKHCGPKNVKPFLEQAKTEIEAENPGKTWGNGERECTIRARAMRLSGADDDDSIFDRPEAVQALNDLIDSILVDWASETVKLPAFPEHKHPSRCFKTNDKVQLLNKISDLNKVSETERKN